MTDVFRVARAVMTNQLALLAPGLYVRLTKQTGRGDSNSETAADIAKYFHQSLIDYLGRLNVSIDGAKAFLAGKTIVEYGPGDFPGVAILLVAFGAKKVYCVDRFPLINLSDKNRLVYQELLKLLGEDAQIALSDLFVDQRFPRTVLDSAKIEYVVRPNGFSDLHAQADLVFSRAVLEHVNDLAGTFNDMVQAMRPGSCAAHLVDLRSHGLHRRNPLDFLELSPLIWSLMYSHKGVPNRWRANKYREILSGLVLDDVEVSATTLASQSDVASVRPHLAPLFVQLGDDDLACLGIWITFRKPAQRT